MRTIHIEITDHMPGQFWIEVPDDASDAATFKAVSNAVLNHVTYSVSEASHGCSAVRFKTVRVGSTSRQPPHKD